MPVHLPVKADFDFDGSRRSQYRRVRFAPHRFQFFAMTFSPEWVSQRAAAEYLGVSERTLLRWRQSGLLQPGKHFARKFVAPNSPLVYKIELCEQERNQFFSSQPIEVAK